MAARKITVITSTAMTRASSCPDMLRFPAKVTGELLLTIPMNSTTGTTTRRLNDSTFHEIGPSFVE